MSLSSFVRSFFCYCIFALLGFQANYEYVTKYFVSEKLWAPVKSNSFLFFFLISKWHQLFQFSFYPYVAFIPKVGRAFHVEHTPFRPRAFGSWENSQPHTFKNGLQCLAMGWFKMPTGVTVLGHYWPNYRRLGTITIKWVGISHPEQKRANVGNHKPQTDKPNRPGPSPHSTVQHKYPLSSQHDSAWEIVIVFTQGLPGYILDVMFYIFLSF